MLLPELDPQLYCWAWNRVYLKSNGRNGCWCDAGESHTLSHYNFGEVDFITDIVNSPEMRKMRLSILDNKHYIPACQKCSCLIISGKKKYKKYQDSEIADTSDQVDSVAKILQRVHTKRNWPYGSIDKINEIQLEPSLPCNLKCPGCIHGSKKNPLELEKPPYVFPLEWFKHMIDCTVEHKVEIRRIQYCGKGEPTLNKQLPEMVKYAYQHNIIQSMDTNSTHEFKDEYLLMNKINCSIDGSTPESYATYRRNGNWDKAVAFMRKAVERKKILGSSCRIKWKYILFDSTESVELLNNAQVIAKDIGIDELDLVITATGAADKSVLPPKFMNTVAGVDSYIASNRIFDNVTVSRS